VGAPGGRTHFDPPHKSDTSTAELYDPFSFEVIRQTEAFYFCAPGEGGPFVEEGNISATGCYPLNTDGG